MRHVGDSMTEVVGHTPLVRLSKVLPSSAADLYVKLEWFNPTGSYKDRMALAMIGRRRSGATSSRDRRSSNTPGVARDPRSLSSAQRRVIDSGWSPRCLCH